MVLWYWDEGKDTKCAVGAQCTSRGSLSIRPCSPGTPSAFSSKNLGTLYTREKEKIGKMYLTKNLVLVMKKR